MDAFRRQLCCLNLKLVAREGFPARVLEACCEECSFSVSSHCSATKLLQHIHASRMCPGVNVEHGSRHSRMEFVEFLQMGSCKHKY
jgi:hypothetical protein